MDWMFHGFRTSGGNPTNRTSLVTTLSAEANGFMLRSCRKNGAGSSLRGVGRWLDVGSGKRFETPVLYIKKHGKTNKKKQGFDDISPKREKMLKKKHVCFLKWVLFPKSSRCSRCFSPLFDMLALDSLLLKLTSMSELPPKLCCSFPTISQL